MSMAVDSLSTSLGRRSDVIATTTRERRIRHAGTIAAGLSSAFVVTWSLDPELFGGLFGFLPETRWIVVVLMCLTIGITPITSFFRLWPIFLFILCVGLSVVFNGSIDESLPIYIRIFSAAVLAAFASSIDETQHARILKGTLIAAAGIVAGSAVFSFISPDQAHKLIGLDRDRLYGLTPHPGVLGYLAAIVSASTLLQALSSKRGIKRRVALITVFGLALYAMWATDSRTSGIAASVALGAIIAVKLFRYFGLAERSVLIPYIVVSSTVVGATVSPVYIAQFPIELSAIDQKYASSTIGRMIIWQRGLSDFQENPIMGNGLGSHFLVETTSTDAADLFYYHSVLINYLAKTGLVGSTALIIMLLSAPYNSIQAAFRDWLSTKQINTNKHSNRHPLEDASISTGETANKDPNERRLMIDQCLIYIIVTIVFASTEAALQNLYPSFLLFFLAYGFMARTKRTLIRG